MCKILCFLLISLILYKEIKAFDKNGNLCNNNDFYTTGVLEYGHTSINIDREQSPKDYIKKNIESYLNFIDLAKDQNVDILVFPEATLNYFSSRKTMVENAFLIPNPSDKIAPWNNEIYSEYLRALSRKCKEKRIYVLINLVEKVPCTEPNACRNPAKTNKNDGYDLYNSNVVFDREGRVISKYQKYNLFLEHLVEQPLTPQVSTFETDFGVKFGHFICFDIMFKEPAMNHLRYKNITNILFPSMWFSELPFLTSNQFHQSWSYANNINLISSGASNPLAGSSGSGIFIGNQAILQSYVSFYITQKLLVASVPKDPKKSLSTATISSLLSNRHFEHFTPVEMQNLHITEFWSEKDVHTEEILNRPQSICLDDDICCYFDIKMKQLNVPQGKYAYNYKLVANYTTSVYGITRKCGELYCGIVACKNNNSKSCGKRYKNNTNLINAVEFDKISIKAKVKYDQYYDDLLVMPNTLDRSILPLEVNLYNFKSVKNYNEKGNSFKDYEIHSQYKIKDILAFGIYGRNFQLDEVIPNSKFSNNYI